MAHLSNDSLITGSAEAEAMTSDSIRPTVGSGRIAIIYQSSNYVVVDKPPDVLINWSADKNKRRSTSTSVSPDDGNTGDDQPNTTVENLLRSVMPNLHNPNLCFGFRFVHRLDYSTSGVLCLALNKVAAAEAMLAFSTRKTAKYYVALVHGHVATDDVFVVDIGIGRDCRHEHRMCVEGEPHCVSSTTKPARTEALVLQRGTYGSGSGGTIRKPATKLLMKAITGRRHQLRLHCRHVGHTIVGDYTYSESVDSSPPRMFLHALRLILPTRIETVDASTGDPFDTNDPVNGWAPTETVSLLNDEGIYRRFRVNDY